MSVNLETQTEVSNPHTMKFEIKNIKDLVPSPYKIRTLDINTIELIELGQSIRDNGLLQPILIDEKNQIIAGHRRWLACQKMNILEVATLTLSTKEDKDILLLNIVENIQRENLTSIETALALKQLRDVLGISQSEIAHLIKKSAATVSKYLNLLTLDKHIQKDIIENKRVLNRAVLDRLATMPSSLKKTQKKLYKSYAVDGNTSKQETIHLINESVDKYYDAEVLNTNHNNSLEVKNIEVPENVYAALKEEFMKVFHELDLIKD